MGGAWISQLPSLSCVELDVFEQGNEQDRAALGGGLGTNVVVHEDVDRKSVVVGKSVKCSVTVGGQRYRSD